METDMDRVTDKEMGRDKVTNKDTDRVIEGTWTGSWMGHGQMCRHGHRLGHGQIHRQR